MMRVRIRIQLMKLDKNIYTRYMIKQFFIILMELREEQQTQVNDYNYMRFTYKQDKIHSQKHEASV